MAGKEFRAKTAMKERRKKSDIVPIDQHYIIKQSPCALNLSGNKVNFYSINKPKANSTFRNSISLFSSYAACSPLEIFQYTSLKPHFEPKLMQVKKDLFAKLKLANDAGKRKIELSSKRSRQSSPYSRKTASKSRHRMYADTVNLLFRN